MQVAGHVHRLRHDQPSEVLGGEDEDHPVDRDRLEHRQGDVARPRGHVDQQVVERAPVDALEELQDEPRDQRPAPDDGRPLVLHQELGGDDADPGRGARRLDPLSVVGERAGQPEQLGDRGSGDVGVEDADRRPTAAQLRGEQRRGRRLPDTALPGSDRDDVGERALVHLLDDAAGHPAPSRRGPRGGRGRADGAFRMVSARHGGARHGGTVYNRPALEREVRNAGRSGRHAFRPVRPPLHRRRRGLESGPARSARASSTTSFRPVSRGSSTP